ncbi:polysaccharide deacteylase family 2 protein [Aestuariivita sp.]|uniref:polysaccharide deacteylase family 2 protein n=1 Tax=Aestuariivita sp. TaxID=1872407 RepID=UPI002173542E|nr:polysaccharide deacteylase family 2 protein [Aestuariivita sp.]MCE8008039.1 hypothetical protein [Aestuariivita sp.]
MARGLLSGLIWGSVIAAGGAVAISLSTPLPQPPQVGMADPEVDAPTEPDGTDMVQGTAATGTQAAAPAQPGSPSAPQADSLAALDAADTAPAEAPAVGGATPLAGAAAPDTDAPAIASRAPTQSSPTPVVPAPAAPEGEGDLRISTEPAQPAPPEVIEGPPGFAEVPAEPAQPAPPPVPDQGSGFGSGTQEEDAPETEQVQDSGDTDRASDPPRVAALPTVDAQSQPDASATPVPSIGQRVVPLTDRDTGADRLPSVVDPAPPAEAAPDPDLPPLERFAASFENPEGKPLMGIVLLDVEGSIGAEALASFPYPLSFAVDPQDPDAAEKMARHRAAGFEVLALVDLPSDGAAQDAETALEAGLSTLDQVIGVMEGPGSGIQGNRALSDQVTAILRDGGFGLITQNAGLNTVQQLAARDGVPSAFVFRDFDGAGQTPTVMRRFLDQAAFRAGQDGAVIMMGRVQPDTISALLLWGLQDRASRVALAPVSAVLTAE